MQDWKRTKTKPSNDACEILSRFFASFHFPSNPDALSHTTKPKVDSAKGAFVTHSTFSGWSRWTCAIKSQSHPLACSHVFVSSLRWNSNAFSLCFLVFVAMNPEKREVQERKNKKSWNKEKFNAKISKWKFFEFAFEEFSRNFIEPGKFFNYFLVPCWRHKRKPNKRFYWFSSL